MEKLIFTVQIKASKEKVWNTLWDDRTYRIWTGVFSEGSCVETDWKEGGEILFLNGKGEGMYSIIERNSPYNFMSFRHLGEISEEKKIPFQGMETMECYRLTEMDEGLKLEVEIDTEDTYRSYFEEIFPIALKKVKEIAEKET